MLAKLTDTKIRNAKPRQKPHKLFDGGGLYLHVLPSGSRYWRLKYRVARGKKRVEKLMALGVYPQVSLEKARIAAAKAREDIREKRDPLVEKQERDAIAAGNALNTFETVALEWIETNREHWSASYRTKLTGVLNANLFPRIGTLVVSEITAPMLLAALRPIEARGALSEVGRARRWCSAIFRYAIATGRAEADPAAALKGAIKTRPAKHYPHLKRAELGDFQRKLAEYSGRPETRLAIRLLLLSFVRPGELRAAKWSEIDLAGREWRIPAERMKMGTEHLVPLSRQAVKALKELQELTGYSDYLFPGGRGRYPYMSENTINKAIAMLGYKGRIVGHGFRATASTILNEAGRFNPDAIERQLAHRERNAIRAIYHRAEYLPERKKLMQWWANLLDGLTADGNVVPLKAGQAKGR